MTVNIAVMAGLAGMHKSGCSTEARFILHLPADLPHHELESVKVWVLKTENSMWFRSFPVSNPLKPYSDSDAA